MKNFMHWIKIWLPWIFLTLITLVLGFYIIYNASWLYGDDFEFMITTAVGKIEWDFHIANEGRFNPFCHFDFNLLTVLPGGTSVIAHYCLVAISMIAFIVFSVFLFRIILRDSSNGKEASSWLILLSIVFLLYYFMRVFFFLNYPERIIVVLMTLFMLVYYRLIATNRWVYAVAGLFVAIYLTYVKEPVFVVFLVIAAVHLIIQYKVITRTLKIFYCLLIVDVLVFLVLYYFIAYRKTDHFYTTSADFSQMLSLTLGNLKVLYIGTALALYRAFQILFRKDKGYFFYDSLLFAGLAYAVVCIVLNLQSVYYYFPAVVLTFPSIIFWSTRYVNPKWVSLVMLIIVLYYGRKFPGSIENIQTMRIETPKQMNELAGYIKQGYRLYWIKNEDLEDPVVLGRQEYQKKVLKTYLNDIDHKNNQISFITINQKVENLPDKSIVFYSNLNIIGLDDKMEWETKSRQIGLVKLDMNQLWKLSAYLK